MRQYHTDQFIYCFKNNYFDIFSTLSLYNSIKEFLDFNNIYRLMFVANNEVVVYCTHDEVIVYNIWYVLFVLPVGRLILQPPFWVRQSMIGILSWYTDDWRKSAPWGCLLIGRYIHFYNKRIQLKPKLTPPEKRCQSVAWYSIFLLPECFLYSPYIWGQFTSAQGFYLRLYGRRRKPFAVICAAPASDYAACRNHTTYQSKKRYHS